LIRRVATKRRQFIRTTALAVASVAVASLNRAAAAAASRPRPFGFSLYGMKTLPVLDAIDHCARIGYRQIELSLLPGFPTEPSTFSAESRRVVRERIRGHGLELGGLMININLTADERAHAANLETIKRAAEIAHNVGSAQPPVIETVMGGRPDAWEKLQGQFASRLRAWAETAGAADVTLCVKAHAGNAVNSPERLLWLFRDVNHPRLALAYDYSHFQAASLGLESTLRSIIPHTRFIHVKDLAPDEQPLRFVLPGEGTIDYANYFRLLDELNYSGPLIVEVSSQIFNRLGYEAVKTAEQAYAFLSRVSALATASPR
jgi:sugar phosphate isomerase/epimerase